MTPYIRLDDHSAASFNRFGTGHLPAHLGIEVLAVEPGLVTARARIQPALMAPNGFLHGGTIVALADTLCGYGCIANLPEGATGFTTVELKSNFLGTMREGVVACEARPVHLGRTTQVWDAVVLDAASRRQLALVRCTQLVLWAQRI